MPDTPHVPPHLLLIGGGHASLAVLRHASRWTSEGIRVTLISEHPHLYYSGMVPELLGGVYTPEEARIDLVAWCRREGVTWHEDRVTAFEPATRTATTASGAAISADLVAIDVGSRTRGAERAEHAVTAKPLHRIKALLDFVTRCEGDFVVVGGGAAGVEVALNVSARSPGIALTLVEPGERLLPALPRGMGRRAECVLRERGATLHLGLAAERTEPEGVRLSDGHLLPADAVLWATGPSAPSFLAEGGLPTDAHGFVRVLPTLQVAGVPGVFAAGDCASVAGMEHLRKIGVHAVKQGPTLRRNLGRALDAIRRRESVSDVRYEAFRPYAAAPLILSTGAREGWWTSGPVWLRGEAMLRLKHLVDLRWLRHYAELPRFPSPAAMAHAEAAG
jgi:NADH dehydrogenase FAD-containing subunit